MPVASLLCALSLHAQAAPLRFRSVSVGTNHVCALATSGAAFCWGDNQYGQLGTGRADTLDHEAPERVAGVPPLRAVLASDDFTCALATTGAAWCWGFNSAGQLGVGTDDTVPHPSPTGVAGGHAFRALAAGRAHACALDSAGVAWCWGLNHAGQLGTGDGDSDHMVPARVVEDDRFASITAGEAHTCALTPAGAAFCWGDDEDGQLGVGNHPEDWFDRPHPVRTTLRFRAIDAGHTHTCAIATTLAAYCWGRNDNGELGNEHDTDPMDENRSRRPVRAAGTWTFTAVTAGETHTCGMTTPIDVVACWGSNFDGELAGTTQRDDYNPEPVVMEANLRFTTIDAGPGLACGVTLRGQVYCWGDGDREPVRVPPPRAR